MARKDTTRPAQLVGLAALAGLFLGGLVLIFTRNIALAAIGGGGAFIVTILVLAAIVLTMTPVITPPGNNPHD